MHTLQWSFYMHIPFYKCVCIYIYIDCISWDHVLAMPTSRRHIWAPGPGPETIRLAELDVEEKAVLQEVLSLDRPDLSFSKEKHVVHIERAILDHFDRYIWVMYLCACQDNSNFGDKQQSYVACVAVSQRPCVPRWKRQRTSWHPRDYCVLYRFNDQNLVRTHQIRRTSKLRWQLWRLSGEWAWGAVIYCARGCILNVFSRWIATLLLYFQGGAATLLLCLQGRFATLLLSFQCGVATFMLCFQGGVSALLKSFEGEVATFLLCFFPGGAATLLLCFQDRNCYVTAMFFRVGLLRCC